MNTNYTPGPWEADTKDSPALVLGPDGRVVATLRGPTTNHPDRYPRKARDANARLIAAAPELLEAVEMVLTASEDGGDMDDIGWDQLRAAFAKAKGCPDCGGAGRGGPNTTDGGEHDDCSTCSGEGAA